MAWLVQAIPCRGEVHARYWNCLQTTLARDGPDAPGHDGGALPTVNINAGRYETALSEHDASGRNETTLARYDAQVAAADAGGGFGGQIHG
jgi:hypothetical protein